MNLKSAEKTDILPGPDPGVIRRVMAEIGEPPFRARQVLRWLYNRRAESFEEMTDLPADLRDRLAGRIAIRPLETVKLQTSRIDDTSKFLLRLRDGNCIESVFLRDGLRKTACISTQVGCALGCKFCATGRGGLVRNLTPSEILGQILAMEKARERVTQVVFMGMGEPLMNVEAVIEALETLTSRDGLGISARRVTLSTSGIVPGIRRLMGVAIQVNLAWSLTSPFDEQRSQLMPVNRRYPIGEVVQALKDYVARSGREVSLEYILLQGVNLSRAHAEELARIARAIGGKINLIAYNRVEEAGFVSPDPQEAREFRDLLRKAGAFVTIRFRRGRDIDAACGQLRAR